jgi:hypothetical protein
VRTDNFRNNMLVCCYTASSEPISVQSKSFLFKVSLLKACNFNCESKDLNLNKICIYCQKSSTKMSMSSSSILKLKNVLNFFCEI